MMRKNLKLVMMRKNLKLAAAAAFAFGVLMAPLAAVSATTPLTGVSNASATLNNLRVENTQGQVVGKVTLVITRSDGKALAVSVDATAMLGSHKTVSIGAEKLGLDRARNVLVVNLTKAEVKALASA